MSIVKANGIQIYYEEAGRGKPLVFVHEFAGDWRSWEGQMRFFSGRYRAVTYSARGYLPSDVPEDPERYSQDFQVEDLRGLMDALEIDRAHICGLSMGSYTTLLFGLKYPDRAHSLTIAGSGYGSGKNRRQFQEEMSQVAETMLKEGIAGIEKTYTVSPGRVQLQNKNPRGWEEFRRQFLEHSSKGSAYTLLGVQAKRPSIIHLQDSLKKMILPVLVILGDEDEGVIEGSLFMKRNIPRAGLEIYPRSGHAVNLEEPDRFNRSVLDFITTVDSGAWEPRDPRSRVSQ
jgi:pimeloyl-ACP methyl ester carboxylesterase